MILEKELTKRYLRLDVQYRQRPLTLEYKGIKLDFIYRIDVVVEEKVIVEIKSNRGNTTHS